MDKNTKLVVWIEVALVAILFVTIAGNHESETVSTKVAVVSHEATETTAHANTAKHEEVAEQKVAEPVEKNAEEKTESEKAEEPDEKTAKETHSEAEAVAGSATVIAMENPAYQEHTKGIVQFTHTKHFEDYKIGCGDCHHDDNAEPLADLKSGDSVVGCIECHPKPGKAPKAEKDSLEYHTEALHKNCIDCHKKYNTENNTKAAPQACGKCHPKK